MQETEYREISSPKWKRSKGNNSTGRESARDELNEDLILLSYRKWIFIRNMHKIRLQQHRERRRGENMKNATKSRDISIARSEKKEDS